MRVAMYYSNKDIRIEEKPVPEIGTGEILMKVIASGICGSDVMEWYRAGKTPLVLGHEVAGEVAKTGDGVTVYKPGDRIAVSHHVPCNTCHYCLNGHHTVCDTLRKTNFFPGGFSEYLRVPAINVDRGIYLVPDGMSYEEATFVEPLACVIRGQRHGKMSTGKTVLVMGSGIAGLLHIALAKANNAGNILATDISKYRLDAAKKFGADTVIHADEDIRQRVLGSNNNRLADLVIVCTGSQKAMQDALGLVDRGGSILFFAPTSQGGIIPMSVNDLFWRTEITLTSSYAANYSEHKEALELIRLRKVDVLDMITHRLPLAETQKGFQLVADAQDSIKVIIEPQK